MCINLGNPMARLNPYMLDYLEWCRSADDADQLAGDHGRILPSYAAPSCSSVPPVQPGREEQALPPSGSADPARLRGLERRL